MSSGALKCVDFGGAKNGVVGAIAALLFVFASCLAASAETINWNTRPATNLRTGGTDSPTYGSAPTLLTVTTSGSTSGAFDGAGPNTLAIEPGSTSNGTTGYINSTMNATVDNETSIQITTINFNEPVYNASVIVGDIDGGPTFNISGAAFNDIVEFRAIDITGATILPTSGVPVNSSIVTWNAGTGRALSTNQNVTTNAGDVTVTFAGPIRTLTIRHISGANSTVTNPTQQFIYIETVTFSRAPQLRLQKTSNGGVGTFNFSIPNVLNLGTTPWSSQTLATSITTATAGTAVNGAFTRLYATNTATTISETGAAGWLITSSPVTCTDSNSAASGNPASFSATVSGYDVTVAATNVRPSAIITCAIINGKRPTLQVRKQSVGNTGSFDFTGSNGFGGASLDTSLANPQSSSVVTLTAAGTVTTITETVPTGWTLASATCTGMAGGGTATLAGNVLTLNAAATAATANIVCTFTNNKTPVVRVQKITTGGFGGPFTFTQGTPPNLATTPGGISTTAANSATPASPTAHLVSTTGASVTLTEGFPSTWLSGGVTCTDSNAAVTGNPTPVATATGATIVIGAARIVNGADITCVFTNDLAMPVLSLTKTHVFITDGGVAGQADPGDVIEYTYAVLNTGNTPATNVSVTDAHNGSGSFPVNPGGAAITNVAPAGDSSGTPGGTVWAQLGLNDTVTFTEQYTVTQEDIDTLQ